MTKQHILRSLSLFAMLYAACIGAAFAQSYPSQPIFNKVAIGRFGPNSTELETLYGGDLPRGSLSLVANVDETGAELDFFLPTAEPGTELWGLFGGFNANCGEFGLFAPYGLPLEIFATPAGGDCEGGDLADGLIAIGTGTDTVEFRSSVQARDSIGGFSFESFDTVANNAMILIRADYDLDSANQGQIWFTEDGAVSRDGELAAETLRLRGDATGEGTPGVQFVAAEIDLNDASIIDAADDNVNIGNDVTIVGDLVVTGTISGSGAGANFVGYTDAAATGEKGPWTVSVDGSNIYTITHNLGLASATDLAFVCTPVVSAGDDRFCQVDTPGTNSLTVRVVDNGAGTVANAFFFNATVIQ